LVERNITYIGTQSKNIYKYGKQKNKKDETIGETI